MLLMEHAQMPQNWSVLASAHLTFAASAEVPCNLCYILSAARVASGNENAPWSLASSDSARGDSQTHRPLG